MDFVVTFSHLHVSLFVPCVLRGQKKTMDFLELELQMTVSHHEDAGTQT